MTTEDAVSAARQAALVDALTDIANTDISLPQGAAEHMKRRAIGALDGRGLEGNLYIAEQRDAALARAERAEAREAALRDALFNLADACDATHDGHKDDLCYVCTAMWEAKAALDATQEAQP